MEKRISTTSLRFLPDSLGLFSLFGLSVAQPLLDLLIHHPQFFVARQAAPSEIIFLVLFLCFLAPGCLVLWCWCTAKWSRTLWVWLHLAAVATGSATFVLLFLNDQLELSSGLWLLPAAAAGVLVAAVYRHLGALRLFFNILFPAVFVFAGAFLFSPAISPLLTNSASTRAELPDVEIENPLPVVLVVFDELPLGSLLRAGGEMDSSRFPNFGALARESTWYRQATVVADITQFSLPSILTGRFPDPSVIKLATDVYHPESLFTLLGRHYDVRSLESITSLCPEAVCAPADLHVVPRFLATIIDMAVLHLHLLLPSRLADRVPGVNQTWGNFVRFAGLDLSLQREPGEEFSRFIDTIRPDSQPAFHFLHSNLPHPPWVYLPSGRQYLPWKIDFTTPARWGEEPSLVALGWQRHFLQVLLADRLLGTLVRHLRTTGLYEQTLLIVAADHGASFRPGVSRRNLTAQNYPDIASVPLLIKFPGQKTGRVSTQPAETIDIMPTVADVLGIRIPWPVDGTSLLDDQQADRQRRVFAAESRSTLVISSDQTSHYYPVVCLGENAVPVRRGSMTAYLDVVERRGGKVLFLGWAADLQASRPADSILIFVNRRKVHQGGTGFSRPDVLRVHSDPGLSGSGFSFEVDAGAFGEQADVRVFAARGESISEVVYPVNFPWRHTTAGENDNESDLTVRCGERDEPAVGQAAAPFENRGKDFLEQLRRMAESADQEGLFQFSPCGRLAGKSAPERALPARSSLVATLFESWRYGQVTRDGHFVPTGVRGQLRVVQPGAEVPAQVAVSVNGLIRSVAPVFTSPAGDAEFLVLVPEDSFRTGRNEIGVSAIHDLESCSLEHVPLH